MVKYKFRLAGLSQKKKEQIIEINVEPDETVADVKKKIRKKFGINDILDLKLIWEDK